MHVIRQKTREHYFGKPYGLIVIITHGRISVQLSVTFFHHLLSFRESLKSTVSLALFLVLSREYSGGSTGETRALIEFIIECFRQMTRSECDQEKQTQEGCVLCRTK